MAMRKILITGAAGRIGSRLAAAFADEYDLVLADVVESGKLAGKSVVKANVDDIDVVRELCVGVDTVVHLAADPRMHASWDSLLPNNLVGTYNVFQAASETGCRRLIFASSVNAVFGYPRDVQVKTSMPARPINLYGATKAWGEAVGSVYANTTGLSVICLRFGWVQAHDAAAIQPDHPYLDILLTYRDLAKLVKGAIEAPNSLRYGVFHGVSNNRWKRLAIDDAREKLGYAPTDDAWVIAGLVEESES